MAPLDSIIEALSKGSKTLRAIKGDTYICYRLNTIKL